MVYLLVYHGYLGYLGYLGYPGYWIRDETLVIVILSCLADVRHALILSIFNSVDLSSPFCMFGKSTYVHATHGTPSPRV